MVSEVLNLGGAMESTAVAQIDALHCLELVHDVVDIILDNLQKAC